MDQDQDQDQVSRVALVISQLRPGGAERVVVHLANGLQRHNVRPLVVCIQQRGELAAELESRGVEVVALGSLRSHDLKAVLRLAKLLRRFDPSAINVHDYSSLPYAAVAGLACRRCPIVFTAHGLLYEGFERLKRRLRFFSRRVRALAAVSSEVRDRHVGYLDWRGPTYLVPNGVEDVSQDGEDHRGRLRRELGIGADEFVFLAVGNARPEKAFEDLIAAAVQVRQSDLGRPFSVLIAGILSQSDYCNRLRRAAETSDVRGLRLLGYRDDVRHLYSAADAFVLSSRSEGLPMVVLEAMMAGLPVIATRVGGIPEAVPADCGLLVEPAQPDQLAECMLRLLAGGKEVCKPIGQAARAWALRQFGIERMIGRYLDVYANVVNGNRVQ